MTVTNLEAHAYTLEALRNKKGFICDMDGVIYHGNLLLPGVREFVDFLKRENKKFLLLTNSSERAPKELQQKLERLGLEEPKDWDDLLKPEYKGLIWMSNPNTAGTAKLVINTMVQMKGHDEAMKYFVELDKNIAQYTKSGSGPSKKVGIGECVIGIGFLHDGITQILDGYDNISLVIPASGTSFEIGATAIFKGAKHPNAAKLWIEFALSPDCVNIAKENESFQFLVIDNAEQPEEATAFGLDPENVIDYDFEDAKNNTSKYVEDYFNALGAAADGRFQTE